MFNRRKNETSMEPVEGVNDEEFNPDASNFESFPREFGKLFFNLSFLIC